jgi:hypothetical protein
VPVETSDKYERAMRALLDVSEQYVDGKLAPRKLTMSREADDIIAALEADLEPDLGRGGRYERIAAWAGKLAGTAGRIAAILHVADHFGQAVPPVIPAGVAERAVRVARVCIAHAEALEDALAAPPELEGARRVAEWLRRHGKAVVSEREILRATRGSVTLATGDQRDAALRLLERHGYVRRAAPTRAPSVGRPSTRWEVHPEWIAHRASDGRNGRYSRSVQGGTDTVHIVHDVASLALADESCDEGDV